MKILHIASISDKPFSGLDVIIPKHVILQQQIADVAFLNLENKTYIDFKKQYVYQNESTLYQIVNEFGRPDLVVFHGCYHFEYIKISRFFRENFVPYIIIPHGMLRNEAQAQKRIKKLLGNLFIFNEYIYGSIAIQCLSYNELEHTRFKQNKFVCTNGISIPQKYKESFNNNKIVFIYIGRYEWKIKGLDLLFDAIKLKNDLLEKNNCHFNLYGPNVLGDFEVVKKKILERNIEKLVSVNSAVYGEKKEQAILDSDIFIQTSRSEGMPMGILEAISYGLPCLVTEGTSFGKIIKDFNAGWVSETNTKSIADCLVKCIQERNTFFEKAKNARLLVIDKFDWNVVSKETIEVYKRLVNYNCKVRETI